MEIMVTMNPSNESENEELYVYHGFTGDVQDIQQLATNLTAV